MCAFDELTTSQSSAKQIVLEYEISICTQEEYIESSTSNTDVASTKSSIETIHSPPAYDAVGSLPLADPTRVKGNFFRRIFFRNPRKANASAQELPSYREAELISSWAKIGIDINDRSQGPRPNCTPEEWLGAMDSLFGAPALPKAAGRRCGHGAVVYSLPGSGRI